MIKLTTIHKLPSVPAVYVMFDKKDVAYVGISEKLKNRLVQHFIRRDSSVTTGASAVSLNPDRIAEVVWWESPEFSNRSILEAAELVAFEIFNPVLRSRGGIRSEANNLLKDEVFKERYKKLFSEEPTGKLLIPKLSDALQKIDELEKRIEKLERQFGE
ncbi:hypothetical protein [Marinicrinis lubricantis]|uniref:GIY-YIG domain-containing protein n=1 Tax=Marinicrinis lubricantis TaxID=2086470 RepID=A0ABW1IPH5_9BACL